jgi:hypothetical protein
LTTQDEEVQHVTALKQCHFDATGWTPLNIAALDTGGGLIDKILRHEGEDIRPEKKYQPSKKDLRFEVKWIGCDDSENLWIPWKELLGTTALRAYLTSIGKESWLKQIKSAVVAPSKVHGGY